MVSDLTSWCFGGTITNAAVMSAMTSIEHRMQLGCIAPPFRAEVETSRGPRGYR